MTTAPHFPDLIWMKLAIAPAVAVTTLTAIALLLNLRVPKRWAWGVAIVAVSVFAVALAYRAVGGLLPFVDYVIFWQYGRLVIEGQDPYAMAEAYFNPFLYPPNALPLFASMARLPLSTSELVWTGLNAALCVGLVPLALRSLKARDVAFAESIPPHVAAVLAGVVVFCTGSTLSFEVGQISMIITASILLALDSQARRRPILAGLWLSIASIKVATTLPILLLFHRKSDLKTWASLAVGTLVLCLSCSPLAELPGRIRVLPGIIAKYSEPGMVNDYSFDNEYSPSLIAIDHSLHRFGLRDRGVIKVVQSTVLLAVGGWLLWTMTRGRDLRPGGAGALVCLFSMLFLYHRFYDVVMLTLPLVYATGRARMASGTARRWYVAAGLATLVGMYPQGRIINAAGRFSLSHGGLVGHLIQITILPITATAIVTAMVCLYLAERRSVAEAT